jgi:cGMP-dependent protein kinase
MLESNKNKTFEDDIVMETDGVIAEITSENFIECIGGNLEEIIANNQKN